MIDTHAHIDTDIFREDLDSIIERAKAEGIEHIIIPAINPQAFDNLIEVVEKYDVLRFGIGVHPHNANEINDEVLDRIKEIAKHPKCVAIGEIGIDYYYDFVTPEVQKETFRKQLQIAKEVGLPVIVHNRDADEDILQIIEEEQDGTLKGVLHCFSSEEDVMQKAMELGFNISFTGNVTFKKFNLQNVVANVPDNRFMIETDSPYITPVPYRGKRNEPVYVKYVAEKIAEIRNITFDEVISMTSRTAKNLFRLAIMIFALNSYSLFAQEIPDEEFYDDDEVYYEYDGFASKGLGFGFTVASFTVVDSFKPEGDEVTYEGQLGLGGFVDYSLFDWLHLEMSYIYAENTDIQEEFANVPEPNTYRFVEASALWMPNPHQRVNFYAITGVSFLSETFWQPEGASGTIERNTALGINGGLGFSVNIKFESLGVLTVSGEWKVNFIPELKTYNNDPRGGDRQGSVDFSTFYSIPRLKVTYYPKWLDFKAK